MASATRALTTRVADFWLLGGASLAVWFSMTVFDAFREDPAVDERLRQLGVAALSLSLVANYPHFLLSYKLAYTRGLRFVRTHWWQLVLVPVGLAALLATAYLNYDIPVADISWLSRAAETLDPLGTNARVLAGPRFGDLLLGAAFNLMTLTIGWHYTKQVFGCVMVYAHFDGYSFAPAQRVLIRRALLAMWALAFVDNNRDGAWRGFSTFSYASFDLPDVAVPLALVAVAAGAALVAYRVFYANYVASGRLPSVNVVVPLVALYAWWLPFTRQDEFYFVMAPLFHSLQYLAFVYRMEDSRLRHSVSRQTRAVGLAGGVIAAGWLAFEFLPNLADARLETPDALGLPFFLIAATLFINIHHYFIDNVLWRFGDPQVRAYLLD